MCLAQTQILYQRIRFPQCIVNDGKHHGTYFFLDYQCQEGLALALNRLFTGILCDSSRIIAHQACWGRVFPVRDLALENERLASVVSLTGSTCRLQSVHKLLTDFVIYSLTDDCRDRKADNFVRHCLIPAKHTKS